MLCGLQNSRILKSAQPDLRRSHNAVNSSISIQADDPNCADGVLEGVLVFPVYCVVIQLKSTTPQLERSCHMTVQNVH